MEYKETDMDNIRSEWMVILSRGYHNSVSSSLLFLAVAVPWRVLSWRVALDQVYDLIRGKNSV